MMSQRKFDMVGTWSSIRKRAKRTPDIIVETTSFLFCDRPEKIDQLYKTDFAARSLQHRQLNLF